MGITPILLSLAALSATVALDRVALSLLRPVHRPPGRSPEDVGLRARDFTVPGDPPLRGWWMDGQNPDGPLVVLAHAWGANAGVVLPLAVELAPVASAVVAYDVRGHGRSDRVPKVSIRQFRDDAVRVVEAVRTQTPAPRVILVGHSLGGSAGALAADRGAPLSGLILVAAPCDVPGTIARYLSEKGLPGRLLVPLLRPFWRLRIGLPSRALDPGLALERVALPTLIVQPELDSRVPPREGERLARAAGTRAVLIPGAGHTDVLAHPAVGDVVREFVNRLD